MDSEALPHVLILSSAEGIKERAMNDTFVASLNSRLDRVCQVRWSNYHEISFEFSNHHLQAYLINGMQPINTFAHVYFKSYFRYFELAAAMTDVLIFNDISFTGSELRSYIPADKLSQMSHLARGGIDIPHTVYLPSERYIDHYEWLESTCGSPFILKEIHGSAGRDNYLVRSAQQMAEIIDAHPAMHFIAQTYIPNESDLRVLVIDNDIKLVIERRRQDDSTHLNNTSQGGKARLIALDEVSSDVMELSLRATQLMNRDRAGVDVVVDSHTGLASVLEVNASPQIGSGAFVAEKLDVFIAYFTGVFG